MNKQNDGYVLIITLLSLVALTVAGMGAMLIASSDISLSGNQRSQIIAMDASMAGVNTAVATMCAYGIQNAFTYAANNTSNAPAPTLNKLPSVPPSSFYSGHYWTGVPSGAGTYAASYLTSPATTMPLSPAGTQSATNVYIHSGGAGGGNFFNLGPSTGLVGANTEMECEEITYFGLP